MSRINIVMICDDNYVIPTGVAITSIIANNEKEMIINIICDNISKPNLNKLKSLSNNNVEINTINADSSQYKGFEKSYSRVSKAALLKFRIPDLLGNIDKVLYLDGDVIVVKNIDSLYNTDLQNNYAAVIKDGPKPSKIPGGRMHSFYADVNYFNSGVMLLNLSEMRKDNISKKLLEYRINEYNYFMDQDAFNKILNEKVVHLGVEYDFLLHIISYQNEQFSLKQISEFYGGKEYNTIDELFDSVVIFHYTFDKPWKYYDIPFASIWYEYLKKSPFKNTKIRRESFVTSVIYKTKTFKFSRKLSFIIRSILFWRYK